MTHIEVDFTSAMEVSNETYHDYFRISYREVSMITAKPETSQALPLFS